MAKEWARSFYNSKSWKDCRQAYIAEVNGLCERCLKKDIVNPGYIVHHIEHLTPNNINDVEITLNFDNLEYLCQSCHSSHHNSNGVTREELAFNNAGELVKIR